MKPAGRRIFSRNISTGPGHAGLRLTAHAGEFAGADSVRETIETLKPDRLGHAVHAADDPAVMELIAERDITIESCPTSNYYTCSVPASKTIPCRSSLKMVLKVTLECRRSDPIQRPVDRPGI